MGQPRTYLAGYRFANEQAGAEAIPTPVALLDQTVLLSDWQPMTFLCLLPRRDTYLVHVLHRFMRYLELPGERPTGFDDQVMALLGDIQPAQIPVVDVPPTTFHLAATAAVRIPTHAAMLTAGSTSVELRRCTTARTLPPSHRGLHFSRCQSRNNPPCTPEAMQFGRALQRLLSHLVHANPRFGPAKLAEIDVR
jgi:hypothetical protein